METRPIWIILGVMLITAIIVIIIRKLVPLRFLKSHHEVAFPIFLQIGVIYAVFLAFVFSVEWGEYFKARDNIVKETSCLLILMHSAHAFPEPYQRAIENALIDYTKYVINIDWQDMRYRRAHLNAWGVLNNLQKIYLDFEPKTKQQDFFYADSLKNFEDLREYRQMRIFKAVEKRQDYLWLTLIILGSVMICISLLFGMRYLWVQAILVSCLAGLITTLIVVIIEISIPFSGKFSLQPTDFKIILSKFNNMQRQENQLPERTKISHL